MLCGSVRRVVFHGRRVVSGSIALATVVVLLPMAGCSNSDGEVSASADSGGSVAVVEPDTWSAAEEADVVSTSSASDQIPDSGSGSAEQADEALVEDVSKVVGFGPELDGGADDVSLDEGVLVFDQGTVGFFGVDGEAMGYLSRKAFDRGALVDWLESSGRRKVSMPKPSSYDSWCRDFDDLAVGRVELCGIDEDKGDIIPSITVDGAPLVTEEHWAAFFEESGWDWDPLRTSFFGDYRNVDWDPVSNTWLFDVSVECDGSDALLFRNDRLEHVTGQIWDGAPRSQAVGFVGGAVIYKAQTMSCGSANEAAGIYAVKPGDEPVLIWSSSDREVQAAGFELD